MDDALKQRLRRMGVVKGLGGLKKAPASPRREVGSAPEAPGDRAAPLALPGAEQETNHGTFWLSRQRYPAGHTHGRHALAGLFDLPPSALDLLAVPDLGDRPAFLDTETTGLAGGAGTLAFLIGVGVWDGDGLTLHLIFMRSPDEETAALHYMEEVLAGATGLVTFNGRGFDVPILESRLILNRMPPVCLDLPHLDLLTVARQLWRDHLPSRALGELEKHILDVDRTGEDIPGSEIPYIYRQYLRTGDTSQIARVFYHNEIDVLSLASLLVHVAAMVVAPEQMALAPEEWAGVGRIYDRAEREADAFAAWLRALSGEIGEIDPDCAQRLWGEMGLRYKRREAWEEALATWDTWIARIPWATDPLVEQAKYYEWTVKDLNAALERTELALQRASALPSGMARLKCMTALRHRCDRLTRKLEREQRSVSSMDAEASSVTIVLATHNAGKRREWQALLAGLPLVILLPEEVGVEMAVEETGDTYEANALIKARALAAASGLPALADDSGLEVDALDGAPGVRSARYRLGSDEVRYRALLKALAAMDDPVRTARFRCLAALVLPNGGESYTTEGVCEGLITAEPEGEGGFGYDPVFYVEEQGHTMAQLPVAVKNRISHRARAAAAMRPILTEVLALEDG